MQRCPCFLFALLKSLFTATAFSRSSEKQDGGDFQKKCPNPSLGTWICRRGAEPRQCGSKTTFSSQGHQKQHTLTVHVRKPLLLRDQWHIKYYINLKNYSSAKQEFLNNCNPLQLNSCQLHPVYLCQQKSKFPSWNRPGILGPTENKIFSSQLLTMFNPSGHISSAVLSSSNKPSFLVARRQTIKCCRLYTNTQ